MQSRSFELWIFGFTDDVDVWLFIPRSSTLRVIVVYPLFIANHDAKNLSFSAVEADVHTCKDAVRCFSASTRMASNVFASESFLILSNVSKLLCDQLLIILQVQLASDMSIHEVMPPILCLQSFSVHQSVLYLRHKNLYFWSV